VNGLFELSLGKSGSARFMSNASSAVRANNLKNKKTLRGQDFREALDFSVSEKFAT
jgi:hypothetical protein